jgi:phosphoribosylformylglycinamidine synthase
MDGDYALLIGETAGHLGQSALLAEAMDRRDGDAPAVDLNAERRNGDFLREQAGWVHAATDLSDGGLALAAFEMADAAGLGITLDNADTAFLFGEDQARYLIACSFDQAEALFVAAGQAGVPIEQVGRFGGDAVTFGASSTPLENLSNVFRTAFRESVT